MRKEIRRATGVVVVAVVMAAAVPAFASHFRASFGSVSYNSTTATLTWQIEEAWRVARDDTFVEVGHTAAVTDYPAGTSTCTGLTVNSAPVDTSNPLFTRVSEMMSGSLSCLGAGQYQVYAANSARIGGVFNTSGNSRFSQAIRFTKHANGTVDLPPMFNNPTLYVLLTASGPGDLLTIDFRATDPEGQAVTYAALTDPASPDYGATALPCSTLVNGVLQIGPSLCVGAENFATDYPADRFYAAKVRAFDPAGNSAEVDSLIHVPGPPVPRVISDDGHGPTTFTVVAPDTLDPTAWTLTCTDQGDASVVVGTAGAGHEARITLALTPGHAYRCVPDATSALGSGTGTYYEIVATDHLPTPTVQTAAGDETTTFHVTQPTAGITTPTSWTVTCTNRANSSDVRTGTTAITGMATDVVVAGLTFGAEYDCVPTAVNGAGTGTGPTYRLYVDLPRTPVVQSAVAGTTSAFSLGLLDGRGSAPTSWSVACTDGADATVHTGTSSTAEVLVTGLVAGHQYSCVPSATNHGGTAAGAPFALTVPPADHGGYAAQSPQRLADTRDGTGGAPVGKVGPGSVLRIPVRSLPGVPSDVSAVTITVTTDGALAPGFVTIYPCTDQGVATSNVNFEPGRQVANLVTTAVDADGFVCVSANQLTDVMVDLTGVFSATGDRFDAVVPFRSLDTRTGVGTKVGAGETVTVDYAGEARIPAGASALVLNVTATESDANGYITVFPCGSDRPLASSLNLNPGRDVPVLVTVKLPASQQVCAYSQSSTHLVVDTTGYFAPGAPAHFVPLTPARLVDTRVGDGAERRPLADGEVLHMSVAGNGGAPFGGTAVSLNATLTNASGPGFLTVYPCDAERPLASNVNAATGSDTPNAVVIKVPTTGDDAGQVCLYTKIATDLVVDVNGYFTA